MTARVGTYSTLVRHWYMLFAGTFLLLMLLLVYNMRPPGQGVVPIKAIAIDQLNISKEHSLEFAMAKLFPTRTAEIIGEMKKNMSHSSFTRPIWEWWHVKQAWEQSMSAKPPAPGDSSCSTAELPLPILRYIVSVILNIPDWMDHHVIDEPFLYLSKSPPNLCVRAIIPAPPETPISPYHNLYQPANFEQHDVKSPWWDSLMVSALHLDTGASIPIHMEPWSGHTVLRAEWFKRTELINSPRFFQELQMMMRERKSIHIYEADVNLVDPGRYLFDAKLEYQDGQWNFEKGPIIPYSPQDMLVYPFETTLSQGPNDKVSNDNTTQSIVRQHMKLPLCTQADLPGRWLPVDALDNDLPQPAALDRYGKFWAPFSCRLRRVSYEEYGTCLASNYPGGMDAFGDSNMRRSIKKTITHGRWCNDWHSVGSALQQPPEKEIRRTKEEQAKYEESLINHSDDPVSWDYNGDVRQLRNCYCEDYIEVGWNPEWFNTVTRINNVWIGNRTTGVQLRSFKLDGLTSLNSPSWDKIFNGTNGVREYGDIAIFSLGNWDAAFMTASQFNKELHRLITLIHQRYSGKQIIYRTPQYYCCRVDETDRHRLLSSSRMQLFNQIAQKKFVREFKAIVWDTMIIGESRTWDEKITARDCPSNHVTPDIVEVENQILMNALCNGNENVHI